MLAKVCQDVCFPSVVSVHISVSLLTCAGVKSKGGSTRIHIHD